MRELQRSDGVAVALSGDLLIIYYESTPTMAGAKAVEKLFSDGVIPTLAVLVVIDANARAPESQVRQATQKAMLRFQEKTTALAYVVCGDGFGSAATRAAISGMLLFARPKYSAKVFANVRDAVVWLEGRSVAGRPMNLGTTTEGIEQFCSRGPLDGPGAFE